MSDKPTVDRDTQEREALAKLALSVQLTPEQVKTIAVKAVNRHLKELAKHAHDDP